MEVRNEIQFWLSTTVYFVFLDKLKILFIKNQENKFQEPFNSS